VQPTFFLWRPSQPTKWEWMWFNCAAFAIGSYLIGSVPSGYLIGRARGVDLRTVGSGNIGATNAFRILGKKWGYLCFACDILKGFFAVFFAAWIASEFTDLAPIYARIIAGVFVVLGHNFPVWLGFRGGKGIATSGGAMVALFPIEVFIVCFFAWMGGFFLTRFVSVASLAAAVSIPLTLATLWLFGKTDPIYLPIGLLLAAMAFWRHRGNIDRLLAGTEPRFARKSPGLASQTGGGQ